MHRLPIISDTGQESVQLPCPSIDLVQLATSAGNDRRQLKRLVRTNPALLLFGLSNFQSQTGSGPADLKELTQWMELFLLDCFLDQPAGWSLDVPRLAESANQPLASKPSVIKDYLAAGSNRELRRCLVQFVASASSLKKKTLKKWIRRLVGNSLKLKKVSRHERQAELDACLAKWRPNPFAAIDVEAILKYRISHELGEQAFDDRLLIEKMASMKQLAYGASHEINNPLANISTRAQTLMPGEKDPERLRKLAVIYEQAMRAHEMISDLMLFANPPSLQLQETDVRILISKLVNELAPELNPASATSPVSRAQQNPISLEVRIGPEINGVTIDPTQISVALKALIRNSIEAIGASEMDSPGAILLRVGRNPAGQIDFSIADNGLGVSVEVQRHLFDPFYSGREAGRGLGFGLSKAWRIAELHRGELKLDPNYQQGARFVLSLPEKQALPAATSNTSAA